ncbi:MAG TPA: ECF transporter S component [Candidatus Limnocylindria bacterium]|nr:ECF transporter S component [Candidatus Limnocylindria bacterium]
MKVASRHWPRNGWMPSADVMVIGLVGAALYAVFNWIAWDILIPGTDDVAIRPHYGLLTFFGFAFGPLAGLLTGLIGNAVGDVLGGFNPLSSWWWTVANGLAGMLAGVLSIVLVRSAAEGRALLVMAAIAAVAATMLGFGFIWIELVTQPEMTPRQILLTEYIPVVVGNSLAAAVVTPVLVLAWRPLHEQLAAASMEQEPRG